VLLPKTLILWDASGGTAPPEFPVKKETSPVGELLTSTRSNFDVRGLNLNGIGYPYV